MPSCSSHSFVSKQSTWSLVIYSNTVRSLIEEDNNLLNILLLILHFIIKLYDLPDYIYIYIYIIL